ncbi:Response regulator receiver protein [Candidatus Sulfopaludibacter sp. SbA4]|nr:Response regulator receiver protein [Candidatus Sulfopaludibacter sp. SbA4]
MAYITLLGLENDLAEQLTDVLGAQQHHVRITDSVDDAVRQGADIVFSTGDAPNYRELIRELASRAGDLAVVVVSRFPENSRWLDALELGAADYCGAPFEPVMMRWLVDSVMRRPRAAAA